MNPKCLFFILLFFVFSFLNFSQTSKAETELSIWSASVPEIGYKEVKSDNIFSEAYEIYITQLIDHNNPTGLKYKQQLFLSHTGKEKPIVIDLDGYAVDNRTTELIIMLKLESYF